LLFSESADDSKATLPAVLEEKVLARLAATKKLFLKDESHPVTDKLEPLTLEKDAQPWTFKLIVTEAGETYRVQGWFQRKRGDVNEMRPLQQALCVLPQGYLVFKDRICRFDRRGSWAWLKELRAQPKFFISKAEGTELAEALMTDPLAPPVDLPPGLLWQQIV